MTLVTVEIDREIIAETAQMVRYWNSGEVLNRINMGEGFTLAQLFDALHEHEIAEHIIREVWEGENDGDRDPLPWANGHGSRLTDDEYHKRADDLAHNEGDERFRFAPRHAWEDEPDVIEHYARADRRRPQGAQRLLTGKALPERSRGALTYRELTGHMSTTYLSVALSSFEAPV